MASVLELDVSSSGTPGTYSVEIIRSPGGEASGTFRLEPAEIVGRLGELQDTLLASSVERRRVLSRGESSVRDVGQRLFEALFSQHDVGGVYRASRALADERGDPLRIVLRIDAPELAAMPWESMFDASAGSYVSRREPLVRHVAVSASAPPLKVQLPLRILAVIASPRALAPLDVDKERENLTRALEPLLRRGAVTVQWLEHATWMALQDTLLSGTWHVVHFIGHGDFDFERDEGVLALEKEGGRLHRVSADGFADLLRQAHPMPRLVVLNACETSTAGGTDLFAGTAATLVRGGVSAVTAMQFEISDQAAIAFCRGFYTAIGWGRGVDDAVNSGRVAILGQGENSLEWITPTLYLRGQDNQLFALPELPADRPVPTPEPSAPIKRTVGPPTVPHPRVLAGSGDGTARRTPDRTSREGDPPTGYPPPVRRPPAPGPTSPPPRPWWRRPLPLAGACLAVVAALGVLAWVLLARSGGGDGGSTEASGTPPSVDLDVDGSLPWTDTGVDVRTGDRVAVTAGGQVFHNEASAIGPEGFPNRPDLLTPYPDLNHAALIGRIGEDDDTVVYLGGVKTFTAEADGRLFLGVNDGGLENNRGYWNATVAVQPRR